MADLWAAFEQLAFDNCQWRYVFIGEYYFGVENKARVKFCEALNEMVVFFSVLADKRSAEPRSSYIELSFGALKSLDRGSTPAKTQWISSTGVLNTHSL